MLTVKIHSINDQGVLTDEDFAWVRRHLNRRLRIMALNFDSDDGNVWLITVYKEDNDIISLFVDKNRIKFTIEGSLPICNWK